MYKVPSGDIIVYGVCVCLNVSVSECMYICIQYGISNDVVDGWLKW